MAKRIFKRKVYDKLLEWKKDVRRHKCAAATRRETYGKINHR